MIKLCAFADEASAKLEGQIAALKRNGISCLELRNINGKNVQDFTLEEAKNYADTLKENGIRVWSIGSPIGKVKIGSDFDEHLQTLVHICKIAHIFQTDIVRAFSFFEAYQKKEKVFEYLTKMVEVAKSYGVTLYHENEKDIYGDIVSRVQEIMDNVQGLKFVYDPANYLQVGERAEDTLAAFHTKTDYFHIKDVIVETGEIVPAGYGDGKIEELIARIKEDKVLSIRAINSSIFPSP